MTEVWCFACYGAGYIKINNINIVCPTCHGQGTLRKGEQVSDTTVPAPAEETVEAAKVESVEASRPAFYTAPRLEFTKAKYLEIIGKLK